eukprot:13389726-Alexandrium_andersonii.AAC.1
MEATTSTVGRLSCCSFVPMHFLQETRPAALQVACKGGPRGVVAAGCQVDQPAIIPSEGG